MCPCVPGRIGIWKGKPEYPEKKLVLGARERTNIKLNPHNMASTPGIQTRATLGGRRALSPPRQRCSHPFATLAPILAPRLEWYFKRPNHHQYPFTTNFTLYLFSALYTSRTTKLVRRDCPHPEFSDSFANLRKPWKKTWWQWRWWRAQIQKPTISMAERQNEHWKSG